MEPASPSLEQIDRMRARALVRREQLDLLRERHGDEGLFEQLVEHGLVTAEQVRRVARLAGRVVATCFICLKRTPFPEADWTGAYFCEHCYKSVSVAERTAGFDEDLLIEPAERILDELLLRRLLRRGVVSAEQIEHAREERQTLVPRPAAWHVLVHDGALDEQAALAAYEDVLGQLRRAFPDIDELRRDGVLARRLLREHLVGIEAIASALQQQLEAGQKQRYLPLDELLGAAGELTAHQREAIVPGLREACQPKGPSTGASPHRREPAAPPPPRPAPLPRPEPEELPPGVVAPPLLQPHKGIGHRYGVASIELKLIGLGVCRLLLRRLRPSAVLPGGPARPGDAGLDLHADVAVEIAPGALAAVPLGFATAFPPGVVALVKDRSSLARRGLHALGGVIDAGYRGEWVVLLANLGDQAIRLEPGDRVAQAVFCRLATLEIAEVDELPESERGAGGFGSTGA